MKKPKTILLVSRKCGVGKTTIADEIAFELERKGKPFSFYDLDQQGGTIHRPQKNQDAEFFVVDTPGGLYNETPKWINASDLVILPTKASPRDYQPFMKMASVIKENLRPDASVLYVINMINLRFRASNDFKAMLFTAWKDKREPFTRDHSCAICSLTQSEMAIQAAAKGLSVIDYAPKSALADFLGQMNEVIFKLLKLDYK